MTNFAISHRLYTAADRDGMAAERVGGVGVVRATRTKAGAIVWQIDGARASFAKVLSVLAKHEAQPRV